MRLSLLVAACGALAPAILVSAANYDIPLCSVSNTTYAHFLALTYDTPTSTGLQAGLLESAGTEVLATAAAYGNLTGSNSVEVEVHTDAAILYALDCRNNRANVSVDVFPAGCLSSGGGGPLPSSCTPLTLSPTVQVLVAKDIRVSRDPTAPAPLPLFRNVSTWAGVGLGTSGPSSSATLASGILRALAAATQPAQQPGQANVTLPRYLTLQVGQQVVESATAAWHSACEALHINTSSSTGSTSSSGGVEQQQQQSLVPSGLLTVGHLPSSLNASAVLWSERAVFPSLTHGRWVWPLYHFSACGVELIRTLEHESSSWMAEVDTGSACIALPGPVWEALMSWLPVSNCTGSGSSSTSSSTGGGGSNKVLGGYDGLVCDVTPEALAAYINGSAGLPWLQLQLSETGPPLYIPTHTLLLPTSTIRGINSSGASASYSWCVIKDVDADGTTTDGTPLLSSLPQRIRLGSLALQSLSYVMDTQAPRVGLLQQPAVLQRSPHPYAQCALPVFVTSPQDCPASYLYQASNNKCLPPPCEAYIFQVLDPNTHQCVMAGGTAGMAVVGLLLVSVAEVWLTMLGLQALTPTATLLKWWGRYSRVRPLTHSRSAAVGASSGSGSSGGSGSDGRGGGDSDDDGDGGQLEPDPDAPPPATAPGQQPQPPVRLQAIASYMNDRLGMPPAAR